MKRSSPAMHRVGLVLISPVGFLAAAVGLFVLIPNVAQGTAVDAFSFYNSFGLFADVGLVALALALTMLVGEFDLSVVGSYGFGAMVGVKLGQSEPMIGLLAAIGVGATAGVVQGLLVARCGLGSVPVSLGGLLMLVGLTHVLGNGKSVPFDGLTFGADINRAVGAVMPLRGVVVLVLCFVVAMLLRFTSLGRRVRAVGGDRKASASLGLPVGSVVTGAFVASGALSAVAGAMSAFVLSSASSTVSYAPLTFAVTAALMGGIAVGGGRGAILGVTCAALGLSLIQGIFSVMALPVYYTNVVMGVLLMLVAALQAPGLVQGLNRRAGRARTRDASRASRASVEGSPISRGASTS